MAPKKRPSSASKAIGQTQLKQAKKNKEKEEKEKGLKEGQQMETETPQPTVPNTKSPTGEDQEAAPEMAGLKEGQTTDRPAVHATSPAEAPADQVSGPRTPTELEQQGLKEGQVSAPVNSEPKARRARTRSEAGSLTSTKLRAHEETQLAIQGLKEGSLTEQEFWEKIGKDEKASLYKKYEWQRGKNPEAQAVWQNVRGKGSQEKKKQLLLKFLKDGVQEEGCLKQSTSASSSAKDKELFEWVPWKQVCDWYGKEEAMARVESGTLLVKKTGKFFEFLLVKVKSSLTTEQRKALAAEQELAITGQELKACKKALGAPRSKKEWEDLWSERRPERHFKLEDALSKSSSQSSDDSQEDQSSEEVDPAKLFLKGLQEGPSSSRPKDRTATPATLPREPTKEEKKALEKLEKAKAKAKAKQEKETKKNENAQKWEKKLEEATQVGDKDKQSKVKKMLALASKGVADLKKACKKAPTLDWGATELANLTAVRDQLEDLAVDAELAEVKDKLVEAAKVLKKARTLMEQA